MSRFALCLGVGVVLALLAPTAPLEGGIVFMKNGYIIQGRIVDKDNDRVVLGFSNGQMTIYQRFIEEVVLEASEEEEIRLLKEVKEQPEVVSGSVLLRDVDLPADINDILPLYSASGADPVAPTGGDPGDGTATDPTPTTNVGTVPKVLALPEEREFPGVGVALTVPEGWTPMPAQNALVLRKDESAAFPSMTVQFRDLDGLAPGRAHEILLEQVTATLPDARVSDERSAQIGFERAFVIEGEDREQGLFFRQVLLRHESRYYLIGMHATSRSDAEDISVLERAVRSMRFIDQ